MKRISYDSKDLAEMCRDLRSRKGFTLEQIAEQLGTSRQYISNAENDLDSKRDGIRIRIIEHLTGKDVLPMYVIVDREEE